MKVLALILFAIVSIQSLGYSQRVETLVSGGASFDDGLAVDHSGYIYASRYYGSTITKISPSGETEIFSSGFASPNAIAFDNNGNLIVPNATGSKVHRVTKDGQKEVIISGINNPVGAVVDSVGNIYISQYSSSKISKLDTAGTLTTIMTGGLLNGPVSMHLDKQEKLYIGNFNNGKIIKYSFQDSSSSVIADIPGYLGSFILRDSIIYATALQRNRIYKVNIDENSQSIFAGSGERGSRDGDLLSATFNGPNGIALSNTGDTLYISDFESRSLRMITGLLPGNPKIEVPDSLNFGNVNLDDDGLYESSFSIKNVGNDTLIVDTIYTSNSNIYISERNFKISAYNEKNITVGFKPSELGEFESIIEIHNNTSDSVKKVVITANVITHTSTFLGNDIPSKLELFQNYPNPFNPNTTIRYSIPKFSEVKMEVFNSLGKKVSTLVDAYQSPGVYSVNFNATDLPSGVYYCRIKGQNSIETIKLTLIK